MQIGQKRQGSRTFVAFTAFLRVVAAFSLGAAIQYWIRLIGVQDGILWRFDLMPMEWRLASVALSVLYPVCAVGLWMMAPWGAVIWFVAAAIEVIMYGYHSDIFGERFLLLAVHGVVAVLYVLLRLLLYYENRKIEQEA